VSFYSQHAPLQGNTTCSSFLILSYIFLFGICVTLQQESSVDTTVNSTGWRDPFRSCTSLDQFLKVYRSDESWEGILIIGYQFVVGRMASPLLWPLCAVPRNFFATPEFCIHILCVQLSAPPRCRVTSGYLLI